MIYLSINSLFFLYFQQGIPKGSKQNCFLFCAQSHRGAMPGTDRGWNDAMLTTPSRASNYLCLLPKAWVKLLCTKKRGNFCSAIVLGLWTAPKLWILQKPTHRGISSPKRRGTIFPCVSRFAYYPISAELSRFKHRIMSQTLFLW